MNEFSLIEKWFRTPALTPHEQYISVGNGDDCAVMSIPAGALLAQSMDTCVADKHFPASAPGFLVGYRAFATSISDLAAMGAKPHSFSLALTLPKINPDWLDGLARGMASLAEKYQMTLTGGDITRGPLTLSFHVQGFIHGNVLCRSGAEIGDRIFVSGTLGDSGGALPRVLQGDLPDNPVISSPENHLLTSYYYPDPKIKLGQWLGRHGVKTAIDISDGFLADLGHILDSSDKGARIDLDCLPLSGPLISLYGVDKARKLAMTAGDDYQLCFCWPGDRPFPKNCPEKVTEIGVVINEKTLCDTRGNVYSAQTGFKHF